MVKSSNRKVGILNKRVINLLDIDNYNECSIYLGNKNIEHMKKNHAEDYYKYGKYIESIIKKPTYVSKHPKDSSIHYIKVFGEENNYVKVVVKPTSKNILFVRTIFVISGKNVKKYWKKNAFKTY